MKLRIQAGNNSNRTLRALLIDAAEQLSGSNSQVLEPRLPWDGNPILVADPQGQPVLISFDPESGAAALLNGLQAAEQLATALPWVNQVYDALRKQQRPPRLVVVSRQPPPGGAAILAACPNLKLFRYEVLRVNGDTGVWVEPVRGSSGMPQGPAPELVPADAPTVENLPSLSDAEKTYFQQL